MFNIHKMEILIKEHGWNNTYFSSLFGKSRQWITDMKKKGLGIPDENMLTLIANKLDTTVEYLTDKTDDKNAQKNKPSSEKGSLSEIQKELLDLFDLLTIEQQRSIVAMARSIAVERHSKDM